MIVHNSISFIDSLKWSTFIKKIVSGKNFKTTPTAVYAVGMTKDFEGF